MKTYSVLEASEKLGVSTRAVQKRCKNAVVRKKDNKYLITDLLLEKWSEEIQSNEPPSEPLNSGTQELIKRIELQETYIKDLEEEIEELKKDLSAELSDYLPEIEGVPLDDLEDFDFMFKRQGDLEPKKGNLVFVPKDKVFIEYTNEEYENAEEIFEDYKTIQVKIDHNEELFNAKVLTLEQSAEHYKNSYFYQRKQNERFIDMHEKLLDTIQLSGKEGFIKSVVEAKKTDWDKD
tara:strand:- start:147 stop:851 length:705 start_codon:yes stop_codon:yes gene_type:complete